MKRVALIGALTVLFRAAIHHVISAEILSTLAIAAEGGAMKPVPNDPLMRTSRLLARYSVMRTVTLTCWVLSMVFSGLQVSSADDLTPPLWRGEANSTFQRWAFGDDRDARIPPDPGYSNPFALASPPWAFVDTFDELGTQGFVQYYPSVFGRSGVWQLVNLTETFASSTTLVMENANLELPKLMWVQITFFDNGDVPDISIVERVISFSPVATTFRDVGGGWRHELATFTHSTCPALETVQTTPTHGNLFIDQVVVDTRCSTAVAEPPILLLLVSGALAIATERIRRMRHS